MSLFICSKLKNILKSNFWNARPIYAAVKSYEEDIFVMRPQSSTA